MLTLDVAVGPDDANGVGTADALYADTPPDGYHGAHWPAPTVRRGTKKRGVMHASVYIVILIASPVQYVRR